MTDTLCGVKGANEFHTDCAKRSVASGKEKNALYDDREMLAPDATAGQIDRSTGSLPPPTGSPRVHRRRRD